MWAVSNHSPASDIVWPILGPPVKRHLRVVKWLGTIPAVGVCTSCNRQFKVPLAALRRVADAQESLRLQFKEHKCKGDTVEAAMPSPVD